MSFIPSLYLFCLFPSFSLSVAFTDQSPMVVFNIIEAVVQPLICDLRLSLSIRGDTLSLPISSLCPSLPLAPPRLWILPLPRLASLIFNVPTSDLHTQSATPHHFTPGHMDVDIPLCPNLLSCPLSLSSASPRVSCHLSSPRTSCIPACP